MCVIIHKPAGIMFDERKLENAANRNNDGYGFAIFDRGKFDVIKHLSPKGNNPDEIIKIMEDAKSQELFLHLRYKTVGDKTSDNCHPFPVCTIDNVSYCLMHNGTMSEYDMKDGHTDSYHYGQQVVRPLLEGWIEEEPLDNEFVQKVLAKFAGGGNKVAIFNSLGQWHIVNKKAGDMVDGCWVSNTYSFDEPKTYSNYYDSAWKESSTWSNKKDSSAVPFRSESSNNASSSTTSAKPADTFSQSTPGPIVATTNPAISILPAKDIKPVARLSFCDASGMKDLEEITNLGATDIAEMVRSYPEWATLLILDLVREVYDEELYGAEEWVAETAQEEETEPHVG